MEPKWTDEQLAEMEKLVVDLEDKKNSKEEIQSQLDVLKSSFKAKTTAVAPDATAVEVEASNGESNLDPGSLDLPEVPKQFGNELEGISLDEIRKNTKEAEKIKTDDIYNRIGSNAFAGSAVNAAWLLVRCPSDAFQVL